MNFLYVLFFIAIVRAQTTKDESKEKRDLFLPAIRQTIVRPAMLNRVVQPIIQDVVQPVVHQKTFQTIVNPVSMTHHVAQPVMQNTMFTNRLFKRSADKDESKEKRDLFLPAIRQTVVRPAMLNRVVQPIIQDVVQPVVHQKTFQTIVNPVSMTHHVAQPVMQNTMFTNRLFKRSADKDESKEKRDLFLPAIRQTVVRPAMLNRVVQPIIQDVVQPVVHQKTFQTIVNPLSMTHHVAQPVMQNTMFTNRFFKRSVAEKEESKEKRDLFLLNSVGQTFVRPAMVNRVVQPIQTIVSPVQVQQVGLGTTFVGNGIRFL